MSEKAVPNTRKVDPRIQRTRDALGDALLKLMREQPFDTITVQAVLDEADVSRSTFYTHYRDKDDLFLSDADEFFQHMANLLTMCNEASHRVAPVREMFAHVTDLGPLYSSLTTASKFQDAMELAEEHFARGIEQRLVQLAPTAANGSRAALSRAFAGAMLSLMAWWLEHGQSASPAQMDEMFHQMVWAGVRPENRG